MCNINELLRRRSSWKERRGVMGGQRQGERSLSTSRVDPDWFYAEEIPFPEDRLRPVNSLEERWIQLGPARLSDKGRMTIAATDVHACRVFDYTEAIDFVSPDAQLECLRPPGYGHILSVRVSDKQMYLRFVAKRWLRLYRASDKCGPNQQNFVQYASTFGVLPNLSVLREVEPDSFDIGPFTLDQGVVRFADKEFCQGDDVCIQTPDFFEAHAHPRCVELVFPGLLNPVENSIALERVFFEWRDSPGRWYRISNFIGRTVRASVVELKSFIS